MKPLITLVIVHWNTPDILRTQLKPLSLVETFQIIVVDNNSKESIDWIKQDFPSVQLIKNKLNRGFAFACNQGVKKAEAEWILFLNPDVTLSEKDILKMIQEAQEKQFDACSPQSQSAGYQKPLPTPYTLFVEFTPLRKILTFKNQKHFTLFGGCLLIRTDVIKRLSGWDERFFVWFEDCDLTKRLIKKKYRIGWLSQKVGHKGGVSFKQLDDRLKKDIFFHSMNVYAHKHFQGLGKMLVSFVAKRFSNKKTLPIFHDGISITVPNIKKDLLDLFFEENKKYITDIDELIIVSNGLQHKNVWDLRNTFHNVRFIVLEHNEGFAATVNIGLRVSTGKWIGTMNDDIILDSHWWNKCLKFAHEKTGSLNPIIMNPENIVESAGIDIDFKGKAFPKTEIPEEKTIEVDATNAAAVLYSHKALETVGIFDEKFGSYLEDIDLSLRLKRKGFSNQVITQTSALHKKHTTSIIYLGNKKAWLDARNWIYVIIKNWGVMNIIRFFPSIMVERLRNLMGVLKSLN